MPASPLLLVGLGNPGEKYASTRHNVGFMAVDAISARWAADNFSSKFNGLLSKANVKGQAVHLLKPQTYMNLSGDAVRPCAQFFKIPPENIIVFYDEIDLTLCKLRVKLAGGSAGHNGIKSMDSTIGTNYHRVRIGVGRPSHPGMDVADYVLQRFASEEQKKVDGALKVIADLLPHLVEQQHDVFMSEYARLTHVEEGKL